MKDKEMKIEQRLENMKNFYLKVGDLLDKLPDSIPEKTRNQIDNLPIQDIEKLEIAFDGRYNIEELLDILEKAIPDVEAQMGLRMAARLTEVVNRLAKHLNNIFSGIAATIALTPIPIADIYLLLILQAVLVCLIASLSGRDVSLDTAKEFILSMGGIVGAGFTFRVIAQQASKILNVLWPGAGSAVSSAVAAVGTSAIGNAAISYYIEGYDIEKAKRIFKESKKEKNYIDDSAPDSETETETEEKA